MSRGRCRLEGESWRDTGLSRFRGDVSEGLLGEEEFLVDVRNALSDQITQIIPLKHSKRSFDFSGHSVGSTFGNESGR